MTIPRNRGVNSHKKANPAEDSLKMDNNQHQSASKVDQQQIGFQSFLFCADLPFMITKCIP